MSALVQLKANSGASDGHSTPPKVKLETSAYKSGSLGIYLTGRNRHLVAAVGFSAIYGGIGGPHNIRRG